MSETRAKLLTFQHIWAHKTDMSLIHDKTINFGRILLLEGENTEISTRPEFVDVTGCHGKL